jgi:hypothetical protein
MKVILQAIFAAVIASSV